MNPYKDKNKRRENVRNAVRKHRRKLKETESLLYRKLVGKDRKLYEILGASVEPMLMRMELTESIGTPPFYFTIIYWKNFKAFFPIVNPNEPPMQRFEKRFNSLKERGLLDEDFTFKDFAGDIEFDTRIFQVKCVKIHEAKK